MFFNLRRPFVGGDDNYMFLTEPGKEEYDTTSESTIAVSYPLTAFAFISFIALIVDVRKINKR